MIINELGFIERGTGQHQSNTVYSTDGKTRVESKIEIITLITALNGSALYINDAVTAQRVAESNGFISHFPILKGVFAV